DGSKASVANTDAKEISAKGGSHTKTSATTNFDGSSNSTSKTHSVERGEGKVTAKTATSTTATSTSGTALKSDTSAIGGMIGGHAQGVRGHLRGREPGLGCRTPDVAIGWTGMVQANGRQPEEDRRLGRRHDDQERRARRERHRRPGRRRLFRGRDRPELDQGH